MTKQNQGGASTQNDGNKQGQTQNDQATTQNDGGSKNNGGRK